MPSTFDGDFVTVVNSRNKKQVIPRHRFEHLARTKGFRMAPSQVQADRLDEGPSDSWTRKEIDKYVVDHGIDVGDASTKAEVLEVLATQTTGSNQESAETPGTGD